MHTFIPYGTQNIEQEDIDAVVSVLKGDYLSTGPKILEFEKKFAKYVNSNYAVAVSSGTAALHCACLAAGLQEGDEVITTPLSFVATSNAILYCKAKPIFVDINEETFNIDVDKIEEKITSKTKAIIPVHFAGNPCNMDKIKEPANKYHLLIIEDAAHALGAKYKNKQIGQIGDMTTFSFHPVKHITTGEGGMITTNNVNLYNKLLLYRNHGITRDKNFFQNESCSDEGNWYYEQICLGYNYRLTDFQAALGIIQLDKMPNSLKRRNELAKYYEQSLKDIKEIKIPHISSNMGSSWHLYIIRIIDSKINRKKVFDKLREKNIGVNVHYLPIHCQPYYKKLGYSKGLCPVAEKIYEEIITLPIHPKISDEDVQYIVKSLKDIIEEEKNGK